MAFNGIMTGISYAVMLLAGLLVYLFFAPMGVAVSLLATLGYFLSFIYLSSHKHHREE